MSKIIAIEGPSFAGKTTLIASLSESLPNCLTLPDYVDFAGGDSMVPHAPAKSASEELSVFNYFLTLDEIRGRRHREIGNTLDYSIIDRSPHTLLAHKFAIQKMKKWDVFKQSHEQAIKDSRLLWPNLVILFKVSEQTLEDRYPKGDRSLFMTNEYNKLFFEYFSRSLDPAPPFGLHIIDANLAPRQILQNVLDIITDYAH